MDTLSAVQSQYAPTGTNHRFNPKSEAKRTPSEIHKQRYIALQPIFNRQGRVFGYEALCRTTRNNRFTGDSREATHGIIRGWLLDGLNKFTDGKPVFLNCTREDLIGFFTLLPVSIVIEVLETVQADDWVIDACRRIKAFGHAIALDDFQLHGDNHRLVKLADYIKVDFRLHNKEQRRGILSSLTSEPVLFIAEKIETREEFESALDEGFDLFQGYYLARPVLLSKGRGFTSWFNHLRLRWPFRFRWSRWKRQ